MSNFLDPIALESFEGFVNSFAEINFLFFVIPLFVLEIIRYFILKKQPWTIIKDSFANFVTYFLYIFIEIGLGIFAFGSLYFWVADNFALTQIPINLGTIILAVILADLAYYRITHRVGLGWATHSVHHSSPLQPLSCIQIWAS